MKMLTVFFIILILNDSKGKKMHLVKDWHFIFLFTPLFSLSSVTWSFLWAVVSVAHFSDCKLELSVRTKLLSPRGIRSALKQVKADFPFSKIQWKHKEMKHLHYVLITKGRTCCVLTLCLEQQPITSLFLTPHQRNSVELILYHLTWLVCAGRRISLWKSSPTTASWVGWLGKRAATWRRSRRTPGPR